jgi:hypothetical protein
VTAKQEIKVTRKTVKAVHDMKMALLETAKREKCDPVLFGAALEQMIAHHMVALAGFDYGAAFRGVDPMCARIKGMIAEMEAAGK